MSDEQFKRPQFPEDDDNYTDDDVPFKLPKSEGYEGNIHKDDTEDIVVPAEALDDTDNAYEQATIPYNRGNGVDDEDIAALHASDPPLDSGFPEDASLLYRAGVDHEDENIQTGDVPPAPKSPEDQSILYRAHPQPNSPQGSIDPTAPISGIDHKAVDNRPYTDDDVPFHLPRSEDLTDDIERPAGNKFLTMPSDPARHSAETLPGTNGLDPNPDQMPPNVTLQNPRVQAQPTVPAPYRQPQPQPAPDHQPYQRPQQQVQPAPQPGRQQYPQGPPPPAPPQQRNGSRSKPLPKRSRVRRPNRIGCWAVFIGLFVTLCGGLTLVTTVGGAFAYARVGELLDAQLDEVDNYSAFQSTFLYDRDGRQLFEVFNEGRRTNVSIEQMPQDLINATVAIEDDSFFDNIGIDVGATTVAFLQFVGASADENTPGGSTITQQLVRNVLFDPEYRAERSVQRKVEEIALAIAMTGRKSKDEILELYLNEIYYGNLAYGAQAASQVFFDKDVSELTLGESALLAGLPQIPAELDPLSPDPAIQDAVNRRWRQVLGEMVEEGYITAEERDEALRQGLTYNPQDVPLRAPHFTVFAQGEFENLMTDIGYNIEEVARGGWQIYTTVDLEINDAVQRIARDQVAQLAANNISNAAVVVLSPVTGQILAMVGSIDYNNDAIDGRVNVTTAVRQPGSTMKPFTYAAALERGWTTGQVIWDTRVSIEQPGQDDYVPRNYDGAFHGPMRIRRALANSYNIPAVQTVRYVGVDYLLGVMERFGVESLGTDASQFGVSLTLGGGEVSPLELTRAYGVFANQGALVDSQAILCVVDNDDNIIYEYENGCPSGAGERNEASVIRNGLGTQVLDPRVAFVISDILSDNGARTPAMGANSDLNTPGILTAVKTGTTNNIKDNWTVGYTRNVAVGVWVGNNNGDPMRNSSGLTGAAPIWNRVINLIYADDAMRAEFAVDGQLLNDQLIPPQGITLQQICDVRTLREPATGCASTVNEWVLDSPVGLPDGQGGLNYPSVAPAAPAQPATGSFIEEVQRGMSIYRAVVLPIAPEIGAAIQFQVGPGETPPPPPIYCRLPVERVNDTPGAIERWFIGPPLVQADAVEAEQYARNNGYAFLPTIDCTSELLNVAPVSSGGGSTILTAIITSPAPGQTVSGATPIIGTAQFTEFQADYYKIEIIGGQWEGWTTINTTHETPVVNGQLDMLPALPSGDYRIRLVVVGDGNHVQDPYEISIRVE